MGYLNKIIKKDTIPCDCYLPNIQEENLDARTTWECEDCKRIWQVVYDVGSFPKEELMWKCVSGKTIR